MTKFGLKIYFLFVVSWFLHLPSRIPVLGIMRFDLISVVVLTLLAVLKRERGYKVILETDKTLRILIAYAICTIPFVEWPGSVIRNGLENFIKAAVFYYFTVSFLRSERDLRKFLVVFLGCQSWRILEPVYLHVTEGYWGSAASMAGWQVLDRLSGAPHDVINPNGLAFVICTVLPFFYFMFSLSWKIAVAVLLTTSLSLYALALTGSRSGIVGLLVIFGGILAKSKKRMLVGSVGVVIGIVGFYILAPDMQDRYLSIFGKAEKNRETFEGRYEGVFDDFVVAMRRPLFGHGLGSSREANANFRGVDQPSHNLYSECAQEIGFAGLVIFIAFIKSVVINFVKSEKSARLRERSAFLGKVLDAMQVWLAMNIVFSFASYGLSSYEWYLFGGLSVVMRRLNDGKSGGSVGSV